VAFPLQTADAEDRVIRTARIAVLLTVTLFTVVLAGIRAPHRTGPLPQPHHPRIDRREGVAQSEPAMDRYGNEITQAVASYKLDSAGSLYEEHSPQTELPRLGSPKS
jgi:hypothetical protein